MRSVKFKVLTSLMPGTLCHYAPMVHDEPVAIFLCLLVDFSPILEDEPQLPILRYPHHLIDHAIP